VLNLEKLIWCEVEVCGDNRLQRAEHSTALSAEEDKIYIFGGVDKDFNLCATLQRIDLCPEKDEEMVKN